MTLQVSSITWLQFVFKSSKSFQCPITYKDLVANYKKPYNFSPFKLYRLVRIHLLNRSKYVNLTEPYSYSWLSSTKKYDIHEIIRYNSMPTNKSWRLKWDPHMEELYNLSKTLSKIIIHRTIKATLETETKSHIQRMVIFLQIERYT